MGKDIFRLDGKVQIRIPIKLLCFFVLAALTLTSCIREGKANINRGFYYWKSEFRLNRSEQATLSRLGVNALFVKFFDVVWKNGPAPVATIDFRTKPPANIRVVPTVFIANDVLKKLSPGGVLDLAQKIRFKIRHIGAIYDLAKFTEIQIDCDWTEGTRQQYFALLEQLRKAWGLEPIRISATIRLHQIKYAARTGVPPVERGMLMFYNMAELGDFDTSNSILDFKVAKKYLENLEHYPLRLDVALPLFSWGVVFQDQRFIGLARDYRLADMHQSAFKPYREHFYQVTENIYLHGTQLYQGDLIRIEESSFHECQKSAQYLQRHLKLNSQSRILFYHFNATDIGVMGVEKLDQIYRTFR